MLLRASIDKNKSTEEQQLRLFFRNLQQFMKREGRGKTRPVQQVVVSAEMAVDEAERNTEEGHPDAHATFETLKEKVS